MEHREVRGRLQFSVLETRRDENHVVGLPFARRARRVDQRRVLAVDRSATAIGVGTVLVAVEYLQFVFAEQKDTAVAPLLALTLRWRGRGEFEMELNVAKLLLRENVATLRIADNDALLDVPRCGFALGRAPPGQI